jgi:hypothetical protein
MINAIAVRHGDVHSGTVLLHEAKAKALAAVDVCR